MINIAVLGWFWLDTAGGNEKCMSDKSQIAMDRRNSCSWNHVPCLRR